jgi:hypothetical protein
VARRRAQWLKYRVGIEPSRLVFIDETWTKTNMAPLRGWAPVGQRLRAKVPHKHWKTMTFLAALRQDRVEAPWLIDGPINGTRFLLYVEKVLVPTLKPGDIVVMDNLGSHRSKAANRHPGGRRQALLPAQILTRLEPHRAVLLQTQALAAQSRQAVPRYRMQSHRRGPRHPHAN